MGDAPSRKPVGASGGQLADVRGPGRHRMEHAVLRRSGQGGPVASGRADAGQCLPGNTPALTKLGYPEAEEILTDEIKDADGVERYTDSLFNSCVPLSRA